MSFKNRKVIVSLALNLVFLGLLPACSDDSQEKTTQSAHNYFDHTHGAEVSDLEKHKFEHEFAKQCVAREVKNSVNIAEDTKRFEKPCLCIATRIMKNLTAIEAKKFLIEKKNTQSLKMSFDEAAYFCLPKQQYKTPSLFGKRK